MRFSPVRLILVVLVTLAILAIPRPATAASAVMLTGFPALKQQHTLTCESSAASMATKAALTETQIMVRMPRSSNPNLGFRGSPDGQQGTALVDYGVYATPVHRSLQTYGFTSEVLTYARNADLKAYINKGWPVVVWVTYALQKASPRMAVINGRPVVLVPHEHAVLAVGYDAGTILANDPWTGTVVRYRWADFDRSWGLFGNMALAVDPCPAAAPVSDLAVTRASSTRLTWIWKAGANAAKYLVTVAIQKPKAATVFTGQITDLSYTVTNPTPGATYQITVQSLSACGEPSAAQTMLVRMPKASPTPTPSPTIAPSPTATPLASPTSTPAPVLTPTP
jgi:uncharacterized protein YvpB